MSNTKVSLPSTTHWNHCNIKSGFLPIDKTPDEHLLLFVKNKLKEFNDKMYLFYEELHNSQEMVSPDLANTKPVVYRLKQIFK